MTMTTQRTALDQIVTLLLTPVPLLPEGSFLLKRKPRPGDSAARRNRVRQAGRRTDGLKQVYQQEITLQGKLEQGRLTPFAILGRDISIESDTWIFGELRPGVEASAKVLRDGDILRVRKLVIMN